MIFVVQRLCLEKVSRRVFVSCFHSKPNTHTHTHTHWHTHTYVAQLILTSSFLLRLFYSFFPLYFILHCLFFFLLASFSSSLGNFLFSFSFDLFSCLSLTYSSFPHTSNHALLYLLFCGCREYVWSKLDFIWIFSCRGTHPLHGMFSLYKIVEAFSV